MVLSQHLYLQFINIIICSKTFQYLFCEKEVKLKMSSFVLFSVRASVLPLGDLLSGGADYGEIPAAGKTVNVFRITCTYCDNFFFGETGRLKGHTRSL